MELGAGDASEAKKFYQGLFGWTWKELPSGDGTFYAIARSEGRDVAALIPWAGEAAALPAQWRMYAAADDADRLAAKAATCGGSAMTLPAEVSDFGRTALIRDPAGASLGIWQARKHTGFGITGRPGTLAWAELVTRDIETAKRFYRGWLGWEHRDLEPGGYTLFLREGRPAAGMVRMAPDPGDRPAHWRPYFQVEDCAAAAQKAKSLGAECLFPATLIPGVGSVSMLRDPQGAVFALMQPATDSVMRP